MILHRIFMHNLCMIFLCICITIIIDIGFDEVTYRLNMKLDDIEINKEKLSRLENVIISKFTKGSEIKDLLKLDNPRTLAKRLVILGFLCENSKNNIEKIPTITRVCSNFETWDVGQIPYDFEMQNFFRSEDLLDKIKDDHGNVIGSKAARNYAKDTINQDLQIFEEVTKSSYLFTQPGKELALFLLAKYTVFRLIYEIDKSGKQKSILHFPLVSSLIKASGDDPDIILRLNDYKKWKLMTDVDKLTQLGEELSLFLQKYHIIYGDEVSWINSLFEISKGFLNN